MGSKKNRKAYVPENLEFLAKYVVHIRGLKMEKNVESQIDKEGLQKAIQTLPREHREKVERYWGLTGGINHSKKMLSVNSKDIALLRQSNEAITSLRIIFRLDYMFMYDKSLKKMVEFLDTKINKNGMNVSVQEEMKYLIAFLVILQNGPKMAFETDPLSCDTECMPDFTFDEYAVIIGAFEELHNIPDKSINLKLIYNLLEMLDYKDMLAIKKTFNIEIPIEEIPEEFRKAEIEPMPTFEQVRNFKERIFPFGCWEVTNRLIVKDSEVIAKLEEFMKCLDLIRKDWSKVTEFKVDQRLLRTPHELRNLDVYNIGGLEFTDIYEVMFLYLQRNLIAPESN